MEEYKININDCPTENYLDIYYPDGTLLALNEAIYFIEDYVLDEIFLFNTEKARRGNPNLEK